MAAARRRWRRGARAGGSEKRDAARRQMATMAPPVTKGLNFTCQGLPSPNSMKGSSMPRPGLVLSAMAASGQPLFCFGFWSRACAARRRAGPRAAAQRGGAGAAGSWGGALPRALVSRGVCSFLAPICVTSELREWSRCGGMDSLGPARAETRGRGHPRDACRPRDSWGPRARGGAATQETRRTGGRRSIRQAILPLPGRCWEGSGSQPAVAKRVGRHSALQAAVPIPRRAQPSESTQISVRPSLRRRHETRRAGRHTKARRTQHN